MKISVLSTFLLSFIILFLTVGLYAEGHNNSLLQQIPKAKSASEKSKIYNSLAKNYILTIRDSAGFYAKKAIEYAMLAKNEQLEIEPRTSLGVVNFYQSNYEESFKQYTKALAICEKYGLEIASLEVLKELGFYYARQQQYEKALEIFTKTAQLAKKNQLIVKESGAYMNMGVVYERTKRYNESLNYYNIAEELARKGKDEINLSYALNFKANTLKALNKIAEAERYYNEALNLRIKYNDINALVDNYSDLADLFDLKNETQKAEDNYLKALKLAQEVNYNTQIVNLSDKLTQLYQKQGKFAEALKYRNLQLAVKDSIFNLKRSELRLNLEAKYETQVKEKELAEQNLLIQERNNQIQLLAGCFLLLIVVGTFLYFNFKLKQEKLKSEALLAEKEKENALYQERQRISRELHDNIGAHLTFINSAVEGMQPESEKEIGRTNTIKTFTNEAIKELRKTVWLINNSEVSLNDFCYKLKDYFKNTPNIEMNLVSSNQHVLKSTTATELFRIIQEAINNALKHADAEQITVNILQNETQLCFEISDNGKGFNLGQKSSNYGLRNMQYRANEIKAKFAIESEITIGTKVSLALNLSNA